MTTTFLICLAIASLLVTCMGLIQMHETKRFGADLEQDYSKPLIDLSKYQ